MEAQYTPEQLKKIQQISLEMTLYFQKICDENNLLFYFCGGCCIGTLRHGGFIPWDDDVDVFMPRDDYERLKEIWPRVADNERYRISYADEKGPDGNLFITIRDTQTTLVKPYQQGMDLPHGVPLDILPLDGYPAKKGQRRRQVLWALGYSLFCAQQVPTNHGGKTAFIAKAALGIFRGKKMRYRLWKWCERHMTKYKIDDCEHITELCSGPYYMKKRYPASAFKSAVKKPFEGYEMPLPVGYDVYLRTAFGDYMEMPPEEKRVAHHDCAFVDLDTPYEKYRGIHYLNGGETAK